MPKTEFGVLLPHNFMGSNPSRLDIVNYIREAESLGFKSLWVLERINHERAMLDPLLTLSIAATITTKPRLGTGIILLPLHDPVLLAKSVCTLDFISNGRLTLGFGLGSRAEEYSAVGLEMKDGVKRFNEAMKVMTKLWTENNVTLKTEYRELKDVSVNPKPIQKPYPPILIGGRSDMVMRRSSSIGNGYIAGTSRSPDKFAVSWSKVCQFARDSGKNPDDLQSVAMTYCFIDGDKEKARNTIQYWVGWYYSKAPEWAKTEAAHQTYGPPSVCVANVEAFIKAGAKSIVLCPVTPDLTQLRLYEKEIVRSF